MVKSIERYFRLMPRGRTVRPAGRLWCPSADVYQTRDGWVVKVELAGVSAAEIDLHIEGKTLHLSGCRRDTLYTESISCQQLEITYSRFEKTIHFPCPIEGVKLKSDYRDGLLILHLQSPETCDEQGEGAR